MLDDYARCDCPGQHGGKSHLTGRAGMQEDGVRTPSAQQTHEPVMANHVQIPTEAPPAPDLFELRVRRRHGSDDEHVVASHLLLRQCVHDTPKAPLGCGLSYVSDAHGSPMM